MEEPKEVFLLQVTLTVTPSGEQFPSHSPRAQSFVCNIVTSRATQTQDGNLKHLYFKYVLWLNPAVIQVQVLSSQRVVNAKAVTV